MKKLLILFLAFGLLTACNNKKGKEGDKTAKDTTENKDGKEPVGDKTTDITKDNDNTTTGWPQKDRDDFLTSCISEAVKASDNRPLSETYCECMLGKIEAQYPDVQKAGELTESEIQDFLAKYKDGCLGGH